MSVRLILSEGFLIVLTSIAEVRPLGEYEAGFGFDGGWISAGFPTASGQQTSFRDLTVRSTSVRYPDLCYWHVPSERATRLAILAGSVAVDGRARRYGDTLPTSS